METASLAAVRAWASRYARAWEEGDDVAILECFTPDASYPSSPFREPHIGHDGIRLYWQRAAGAQTEQRVLVGDPIVEGDRACVEWWATFREPDGSEVTLPGALILTFASDGRCSDLREYWNLEPGRHAPFRGWGS